MNQITRFQETNEVLDFLRSRISSDLGSNLIGLYLFGSLTYGGFNPDRSDIDLVAILAAPASQDEIDGAKRLLSLLEERFPKWAKRVEVSYTPKEMIEKLDPPGKRPYFGDGKFWSGAQYGNEWIINNFLLYKHGISLFGPDVKTLLREPSIEEVKEASVKYFYDELEPILRNKEWLGDNHYRSYIVLNLCRILYTVIASDAKSKKVATSWVLSKFPEWADLIQAAENWRYGDEFAHQEEVLSFIRFVQLQLEKTS